MFDNFYKELNEILDANGMPSQIGVYPIFINNEKKQIIYFWRKTNKYYICDSMNKPIESKITINEADLYSDNWKKI